jgi:hypothetical protein
MTFEDYELRLRLVLAGRVARLFLVKKRRFFQHVGLKVFSIKITR